MTGTGGRPSSAPVVGAPGTGSASRPELVSLRWWHLAEVAKLERRVFDVDPWTPEMFWSELAQGRGRYYLAALVADRIVGYAGLAVQDDEAYIQTVGVDPRLRGCRLGSRLMVALLREARHAGARSCGLEVRTDNLAARALYSRLGFVDIGLRRAYYQPSGGDAYVMRVRPIDTVGYAARLDAEARAADRSVSAAGPPPSGAERSPMGLGPDSSSVAPGADHRSDRSPGQPEAP